MVKLLSCASASTAGFCCRLQSGQLCLEAPTIERRQQGLADLADAAKQAAATLSDRPPYCLNAALRALSPARQSGRVSILDTSAGSSHSSCVWQGHHQARARTVAEVTLQMQRSDRPSCPKPSNLATRPPASTTEETDRGDAAGASVQQVLKLSMWALSAPRCGSRHIPDRHHKKFGM